MSVRIVSLFLTAACALAGCSGGDGGQRPAPATTRLSGDAASPVGTDSIPSGRYETTATRQEALDAGFSRTLIDRFYGADGRQRYVLEFGDSRWRELEQSDSGVFEIGDSGTSDRGNVLATTAGATPATVVWSLIGGGSKATR